MEIGIANLESNKLNLDTINWSNHLYRSQKVSNYNVFFHPYIRVANFLATPNFFATYKTCSVKLFLAYVFLGICSNACYMFLFLNYIKWAWGICKIFPQSFFSHMCLYIFSQKQNKYSIKYIKSSLFACFPSVVTCK